MKYSLKKMLLKSFVDGLVVCSALIFCCSSSYAMSKKVNVEKSSVSQSKYLNKKRKKNLVKKSFKKKNNKSSKIENKIEKFEKSKINNQISEVKCGKSIELDELNNNKISNQKLQSGLSAKSGSDKNASGFIRRFDAHIEPRENLKIDFTKIKPDFFLNRDFNEEDFFGENNRRNLF